MDAGSSARDAAQQTGGPPRPPGQLAPPGEAALPDRLWTVPNVLSLARLAGVPVFLWLVLGPHADGWAVLLLVAVSGASDWLDGKIARRFAPGDAGSGSCSTRPRTGCTSWPR